MSEEQTMVELRRAARDRRAGQGARIKRALLLLAIPATASLATACYGAPMTASGAVADGSYETICGDAIDNDGDGLVDGADSDCSGSSKGCEE